MSDTPSVPAWSLEFNSRVSAFSSALGVEETKVREVLADYGATGEDSHSLDMIDSEETLPMADLFQMFVDSKLAKKGRLRLAVPHLRGKTSFEDVSESSNAMQPCHEWLSLQRPKADWSDLELLSAYDDTSSDVWDILRKRSHGRPFVVFAENGSVNVNESLKLLVLAKRQPTHPKHLVNGKLVRVFRAGEFLARTLNESPFRPGQILVDDYCHESGTNWKGVSEEARIICRLHVAKVEKAQLSSRELKSLAARAQNLVELREELDVAALLYDELKGQDKLPSLKILSSDVRQEPFSGKLDKAF